MHHSVETARGAVYAVVEITDEMWRGMVTLPHGHGMLEQQSDSIDNTQRVGPDINRLSDSRPGPRCGPAGPGRPRMGDGTELAWTIRSACRESAVRQSGGRNRNHLTRFGR